MRKSSVVARKEPVPWVHRGFTLIEIMLVVAALAILAGMTIVAINPAKQLSTARDSQRLIDTGTIWSAVHQYALDNHGALPAAIPSGTLSDCTDKPLDPTFTICRTDQCALVLPELISNQTYLSSIPLDPITHDDTYSGYNIIKDTDHNNRITVCAPGAENDEKIYTPH